MQDHRRMKMLVLLAGALLMAPLTSAGALTFGGLDSTFGSNGKVKTPIGFKNDVANAMAIQSNGKIVVAGRAANATDDDFAIARYNSSGSFDNSFGSSGRVTTNIGRDDEAFGVAIQTDGKIVAAGVGGSFYFGLARYDASGNLDATFGTGGKVKTLVQPYGNAATAVGIQADGKIVAVGYAFDTKEEFALARYNTDGSLDAGFGTGGTVTTPVGASADKIDALAIQGNQKLVVGGWTHNGVDDDFALARYNTNGTLDGTFGSGGIVTTPITTGDEHIHALAIQPDGKIIAAGWAYNAAPGNSNDYVVVRYNANGTLDGTFGSGGVVTTSLSSGADEINGMALEADGTIVVGGQGYNGHNIDFSVASYSPSGNLCGSAITDTGTGDDVANAVAVQSDGKAVLAGFASNGTDLDFSLIRYLVGTSAANQPDATIKAVTAYVGSGVFNTTAAGQTVNAKVRRGAKKVFTMQVTNAGSSADAFKLLGTKAKRGFTIKYLAGATGKTNITSQVLAGTYTTSSQAACASSVIRAVVGVKSTAAAGSTFAPVVTATSVGTPSNKDAVKASVVAK